MAHILEYNNYQVNPTEEAFLIKPIRDIYNADRTKNKEKFMQYMSVLYFLVDPRSSYNYIIEEDERLKEIIAQEGLPQDFKIDKKLQEAIDIYRKHVTTSSTQLLEDTRVVIDKIRGVLKETDFSSLEEKDKINALKTVASITQMIPKLVKDLTEAEQAVTKELEEKGRARGGNESKTFMDDMQF